MDAIVVFGGL
jgi:hypothetical protein